MDRYIRQVSLPEVGLAGQQKLRQARILVVGAGGLGCPVLTYLVGAGVGFIRLLDADQVDLTNLHRQTLYQQSDLGLLKVEAAKRALLARNPEITLETHACWLTPANVQGFIQDIDLVIDATDNRAVTYILSDACLAFQRPLVSASALSLAGYVGVFCGTGPSYRAFFPDMPSHAADCSSQGVLGPVVGLLGCMQAQLALQLILNLKPNPTGKLWHFDMLRAGMNPIDFSQAPEPKSQQPCFISLDKVHHNDCVIELRSEQEAPSLPVPHAQRISLDELPAFLAAYQSEAPIVTSCQVGIRAWQAARMVLDAGFSCKGMLAMALFLQLPPAGDG